MPLDGGPATTLAYGPVGEVAYGPATVLLSAPMGREAAYWKRYRGGTAGKLWIDREGDGEFVRLHEDLDGNIEYPLWVGTGERARIAFLSDHEGVGAVYSSAADGSDLRRHTPLAGADEGGEGFYARHAATDGTRVVYASAGELWLLDDLDGAEPRRLDIRLGGQRADLQPYPLHAAAGSGPPRPTTPDAAARSQCAAPCTGSPTVRGRPARSPRLTAYEPGCRTPSAPTARSGWCG